MLKPPKCFKISKYVTPHDRVMSMVSGYTIFPEFKSLPWMNALKRASPIKSDDLEINSWDSVIQYVSLYYSLLACCIWAFNWYQYQWPWITLNSIMAILCYFTLNSLWIWCAISNCWACTRNSSGDEIANVNFLYDDVVHALKIKSCINSATDRFLQCRFTKFSEITPCNSHYAVQGHSRSPISVPVESSYTISY